MNFKSLVLPLAFVTSMALSETERKFVQDPEDFYIHTTTHVDNVKVLANETFEKIKSNPEKYREAFNIPKNVKIDENLRRLLLEYIDIHDEGKLNTNPEFLATHGVDKPVIIDLYSQYGRKAETKYVDLVNRVDHNVGKNFFQIQGIPDDSWKKEFVEGVEKFTDSLERGANPVTKEEMGRETYTESDSLKYKIERLKTEGKDSSEIRKLEAKAELATDLEQRYPKIATPYSEARKRFKTLTGHLKKAGLFAEYLDQFSQFEIIKAYQKKYGKIPDVNDPALIGKFRHFLLNTKDGEKVLSSRVRPEVKHEAMTYMKKAPTNDIKSSIGILNLMHCEKYFQNLGH